MLLGTTLLVSCGEIRANSEDDKTEKAVTEDATTDWSERLRDVTVAMAIFEGGELPRSEIRPLLKRIGRPAKAWLQEAPTPLPGDRRAEAEVVERAAVFLVNFGGSFIPRHLVNDFLLRWTDWVERDEAAKGSFGPERLWETVALLVNSQANLGAYPSLVALLDEEGRFPLSKAPLETQRYLLRVRASTFGALGRFTDSRRDLVRLSEILEASGSVEDELQKALAWFAFETLQGRLDRASGYLSRIEELTETVRSTAASHRSQELTGALWTCRARFHLAADEYSVTAKVAASGMDALDDDFKQTTSGYRVMDSLRFLAFLAVRRQVRSGPSNAPGDDHDGLGSEATAIDLETASTLPQFDRMAVALERSLLLSRSGRADEALALLDGMESQDPLEIPPLHRDSPLLAMRYASRRFEAARALGDDRLLGEAAGALRATFQRWLECWRQVPRMPGGVGYLQHPERRRALHLVLDATLPAGSVASPSSASEALDIALQADGCGTISARLNATPATSRDLISMAKEDGATLVIVVPGTLGTHRFTVDGAGVQYRALDSSAAFEQRLSPLVASLRSRPPLAGTAWPSSSLRPAVDWLSQRLVPETATGPVYFAGLEALGFVPVEALLDKRGEFLGMTRAVARVPSVAGLLVLRREQKTRQEERRADTQPLASMELFVAEGEAIDEISRATLPALSYSVSDYAALSRATQANVRFRRGEQGTRAVLQETLRSGVDLHVTIAHGGHPAQPPYEPGLFLRPRPQSTTLELTSSTVIGGTQLDSYPPAGKGPVRVALLAACGAGAGPLRRGDAGASDFSGALLSSHIPTALVAQERVELQAAKSLVQEFAASFLRDQMSAGDALLMARRALASKPATSHPHFWSPLQLHGWTGTRR